MRYALMALVMGLTSLLAIAQDKRVTLKYYPTLHSAEIFENRGKVFVQLDVTIPGRYIEIDEKEYNPRIRFGENRWWDDKEHCIYQRDFNTAEDSFITCDISDLNVNYGVCYKVRLFLPELGQSPLNPANHITACYFGND